MGYHHFRKSPKYFFSPKCVHCQWAKRSWKSMETPSTWAWWTNKLDGFGCTTTMVSLVSLVCNSWGSPHLDDFDVFFHERCSFATICRFVCEMTMICRWNTTFCHWIPSLGRLLSGRQDGHAQWGLQPAGELRFHQAAWWKLWGI